MSSIEFIDTSRSEERGEDRACRTRQDTKKNPNIILIQRPGNRTQLNMASYEGIFSWFLIV